MNNFHENVFVCLKMCRCTRQAGGGVVVCSVDGRDIQDHAASAKCPHPALDQFQKWNGKLAVLGLSSAPTPALIPRRPAPDDPEGLAAVEARIERVLGVCQTCPYREGEIRKTDDTFLNVVVPCELAVGCCGGGPRVVSLAYALCPADRWKEALAAK